MLAFTQNSFLRRKRRDRTGAPIPPPTGPLNLLSATVTYQEGADAIVALVFDATEADPLVEIEAAASAQWTARINGFAFAGSGPFEVNAFNNLALSMVLIEEAEGSNVISYAATPADIGTESGRMLAAFVDRELE